MKIDRIIPIVAILGIGVLFMFPEPESNFGWYVLTAIGFVSVVGVLVWLRRKNVILK